MSLFDNARADTVTFLQEWGEPLLRRRSSVTYDDRRVATESWDASLSFTGDFQALSGKEVQAEAGLEPRSDYKIITEYNVDVVTNDRVERGGETFRVNGPPRDYEDHKTIFVTRKVQQP